MDSGDEEFNGIVEELLNEIFPSVRVSAAQDAPANFGSATHTAAAPAPAPATASAAAADAEGIVYSEYGAHEELRMSRSD